MYKVSYIYIEHMLTHMREESAVSSEQTTLGVLHHISKETLVTNRAKADFFHSCEWSKGSCTLTPLCEVPPKLFKQVGFVYLCQR